MTWLCIALVVIILLELWFLAIQCRRNHPFMKTLRTFRYAHRGLHDKPTVPENSMAAFRRALDNFYGVELDVHLMADGNLAVIHDASLLRTAGADVMIEDLTVADLKKYRLEGTEERIPLLGEVLSLFEGRAPIIVELKAERGNHDALTAAAVEELDKYRVAYCIESFDPRCLMWLKRNRDEIVRGQLSEKFLRHGDGGKQSKFVLWMLGNLLTNFLTRPDFIAYRFSDRKCLAVKLCRTLYRVAEFSWTITSRREMQEAEGAGCTVIFEQFDPYGKEENK